MTGTYQLRYDEGTHQEGSRSLRETPADRSSDEDQSLTDDADLKINGRRKLGMIFVQRVHAERILRGRSESIMTQLTLEILQSTSCQADTGTDLGVSDDWLNGLGFTSKKWVSLAAQKNRTVIIARYMPMTTPWAKISFSFQLSGRGDGFTRSLEMVIIVPEDNKDPGLRHASCSVPFKTCLILPASRIRPSHKPTAPKN